MFNGGISGRRSKLRSLNGASMAAVIALMCPELVYAQAATPEAASQENRSSTREDATSQNDPAIGLDIVVTAQKRSEALLSTAAPVTALTSESLTRQGAVRIADYAATVPGLNMISSQAGQTVVVMRGVNTGFGASTPATTATYIDDSPFGSSTVNAYGSIATLDLDPATLSRVEVLRGPQGTLYGASSLGGLIKYVTAAPSLSKFSGRAELSATSVAHGGQGGGARALIDGPIIQDQLGISVSAFYRRDPGFIDDPIRQKQDVDRTDVYGGRVALLWKPTDRLSIDLTALLHDTESRGTSSADLKTDQTPIYGKYSQFRYGDEYWKFRATHFSLRGVYDMDWATLTSITSYQIRKAHWNVDATLRFGQRVTDATGIPNVGTFDNIRLNHKRTTQELRLTSPESDSFEWLAGFYYNHESSDKAEVFLPINTVTFGRIPELEGKILQNTVFDKYDEYAGYADVTYHFSTEFKVLAGIRYSSNKEEARIPASGILVGAPNVAIGSPSDNSLTYLIAPSLDLGNHLFYARVASGFRPGGPTGAVPSSVLAGAPVTFGPDSLTNYELGYKGKFPSLGMTVDVSGFYIDWKDIQVLSQINGFNITGNAGKAKSSGFEFAWTWRPVSRLSLSANGAYTVAKLTADAPAISARDGDRLPYVPKFQASASADYEFPITGDAEGFIGATYQYVGSRVRDFVSGRPASNPRDILPSYNVVNLRAGVTIGSLSIEGFIKNVGDTYGFNRIVSRVRNGFDAPLATSLIQPRTLGLSIINKF